MDFTRRILTFAVCLVALTVGPPSAAETTFDGGDLVVALQNTPRVLNPAVQSGGLTGLVGAQLFASPLRYDEGWTPKPYLAKDWTVSEDGLTVTLLLEEDATFHDGVPITSKDVAFSVAVVQEHHPFQSMFAPVESVSTPDLHTAVLHLSQPHPALLLAMSGQLMPIIPKHIYGDGQDLKTHPRNSQNVVGSGPFKLVEFKPGAHVILERYDGYWMDGLPYLDRIVAKVISDSVTRTIALERGDLHLSTFESEPSLITRLSQVDSLIVSQDGYGGIGAINWLAMNTKRGPLSNVKVRQAIAHAIDKNFILNVILRGTAKDAKTGIHPDSPFYNATVAAYDLNLEKAKSLLDDAGYPLEDGRRFEITMELVPFPGYKPQSEYIKQALSDVGIMVDLQAHPDFPSWARTMGEMNFDMSLDTVFNWGDPVIGVNRTYMSSNIGKGVWSNTQGYTNPRVDELLEMAAIEQNAERRAALYKEFQQIIAEDVPIYFLNAVPMHTIHSDRVVNAPKGIWASSSPMDRMFLKE